MKQAGGRLEVRKASDPLLHPGHTDQHQACVPLIEDGLICLRLFIMGSVGFLYQDHRGGIDHESAEVVIQEPSL